ncbi:MAG: type 2 isopentenyl-diphosphate Delta-isomerase [Bdellovibrio sp.]|nr:type 2 isopentenyl-diphosphate Delta-isomerase [Bdellovibrio sp.]
MTEDFEQRKKDHIRLALSEKQTQGLVASEFSKIKLLHHALPEINFNEVSLETTLIGQQVSSPHFVSSMTAGHADSKRINLNLALASEQKNWLMGVGSQRRELTDSLAVQEWQTIKKAVPNAKFISNIGILELIQNPVDSIVKLVENLDAKGVIVHLNPLQEVFQKNPYIDMTLGFKAIETLVKGTKTPVVVKEVGFGINSEITQRLFELGVAAVDVAGSGGTHWGWIEALRQEDDSIERQAIDAFSDWGQTTVDCLLHAQEKILFNPIWASGGIRNGVDSAKCLALGARAVGLAQPLMKAALDSEETVLKVMDLFDYQLKVAMFCTGVRKCEDYLHKKVWQCQT